VLAVIVPLQPIIILGVRQYIEHNETAARLDRLRIEAENILQEAIDKKLSQQDIEKASYSLQAQIYDNRRRSPFIFDWIYARSKSKDEKLMNVVAEDLVQQFIQKP